MKRDVFEDKEVLAGICETDVDVADVTFDSVALSSVRIQDTNPFAHTLDANIWR